MKVSVIIPIFNGEKYLDACIDGLKAQTHSDLEIILVNDGSTDASLEICQRHAQTDSRIQIISKAHSEGAGPARNSAIDASHGEFMMFIDADDRIEKNMVEKLLKAITENNCDVAVCAYETYIEGTGDSNNEIIRFDGKVLRTPEETRTFFAELFPEGFAGYLWNKIYRSEVIRSNNLRYPAMKRLQDGVFNVNFFNCASSCCIIEDVLYHYRVNAQTDMFRKCPKNYYDLIKQFSEGYLKAKEHWGNFSDEKISVFFLNELGTCIENTYSPQWSMTKTERKEYFQSILNDSFFRFACGNTYSIGKYRTLLLKLLEKRCFFAISAVVKLKIIMKTGFKGVFYSIKRIGNHG